MKITEFFQTCQDSFSYWEQFGQMKKGITMSCKQVVINKGAISDSVWFLKTYDPDTVNSYAQRQFKPG